MYINPSLLCVIFSLEQYFPVISTWVSQLALTCHGLLTLQIAAKRHVDLLDFSTGTFIGIQTIPVY